MVTLLATGVEGDLRWEQESAVAVARAWAEQGTRVFLADLGLERPTLHDTLGVPNEEGISDMFRFGASVQRVAHRVGELPFFFTAAGAPVFGSEDILRSERWQVLIEGFSEARAVLLLYLPSGEPGAEAILARTTDLVILGQAAPDNLVGLETALAWIAPRASEASEAPALPTRAPDRPEDDDAETHAQDGRETIEAVDAPTDPGAADSFDLSPGPTGGGADDGPVVGVEGQESPVGGDPGSVWDIDLETADTRTFEVPDEDDAALLAPEPAEPGWDTAGDGWGDVTPGLEVAPDLGGSFGDVLPAVGGAGEVADELEPRSEEPSFDPASAVTGAVPPPAEDPGSLDLAVASASVDAGSSEEAPSEDRPGGGWGDFGSARGAPTGRDAPTEAPFAQSRPISSDRAPGGRTPRSRRWLVWGGGAAIVLFGAWQLSGTGFLSGDGAGGAGGEPPPADATPQDTAGETPGVDGGAALPADMDPGEPTSPVQDASLVIQSFPNPAEAQDFADRLSESLGELLFTVVPSLVNGETWYRTVAGPARDISEIPGIQQRIEQANLSLLAGRTGWFARRTGLAYLLTELSSRPEADALAFQFREDGIPAYVLAIDYSAGVRRYRVYAGAYAQESEAAPLARILANAGVEADLVPRLGSMPSDR